MQITEINYPWLLRYLLCTLAFTFNQYCRSQSVTLSPIPEAAVILSQYIQKKSLSGKEKAAGTYFAALCRSKGLVVEELNSTGNAFNFSASLFPLSDQKPNIIFLNHIDVVPEGNINHWQYPPFSGTISDSVVWGRGAIDFKGVAVMQLLAIERFRNRIAGAEIPYNVTLLCVAGEESGNQGIKAVLENSFQKLNPVVVYGEGGAGITGISTAAPEQPFFGISVAEKKAVGLQLSLRINSSGHGSVPPPVYANKVMVRALHRLLKAPAKLVFDTTTVELFKAVGRYEKGIRRLALRHPRLFKPVLKKAIKKDPILLAMVSNTVTVTNISNAALPVNQIAPEITVLLDCRLLPGTDTERFIAYLHKKLRAKDITFTVLNETPTAPVSEKGSYYTHLEKAIGKIYTGSAVIPVLTPSLSDNNFLRKLNIPVYGLTPVLLTEAQLHAIHNSNEHLTFRQLQNGIALYDTLLQHITGTTSVPR